jgi:hypothetical protein
VVALSRLVVVAVVGLLGCAILATVPPTAHAAIVGTLRVTPSAGTDVTPIDVVTSGGCPLPATNTIARIYGHGFPPYGQNVVGNSAAGISHSESFDLPLLDTLRAFATRQSVPVTFTGTYTLVVTCQDRYAKQQYGQFMGALHFTSAQAWVAGGTPTPPPLFASSSPQAGVPAASFAAARPALSSSPASAPSAAVSSATGPAPPAVANASSQRHSHTPLLVIVAVVVLTAAFFVGRLLIRRRVSAPDR